MRGDREDDVDGAGGRASRFVREALGRGLSRIRESEPGVRGGEAEGVHRMRTSTRRLRSELRLLRGLVDPGWAAPLEEDLKRLAQSLGVVRDLDVLGARLRDASGDLDGAAAPLLDALRARRDAGLRALIEGLDDEPYRRLLRALEGGPPPAAPGEGGGDEGRGPAREALLEGVARAWKSLRKAARRLSEESPDEEFHEARKRAKRALHAAEAVAGLLKPGDARGASKSIRRLGRLKDVLGEHQDAVVACRTVWEVAAESPSDARCLLASGRLIERQARAAEEARGAFFGAWRRLDRKAVRSWMEG